MVVDTAPRDPVWNAATTAADTTMMEEAVPGLALSTGSTMVPVHQE